MQKLKDQGFPHLTNSIIRVLSQNRIFTILDFLQEDTVKLSVITKLTLPQVLAVRNDIFKKYSAPLVCGTTLLLKTSRKNSHLHTGIQSLDTILEGGIPVGSITEICGLTNCGKSQLCFQLAVNCVRNTSNNVLYIDTKGDFSATRIQKSLAACGFSYKEMAEILSKIKVINIWTMDELVDLLKSLKANPDIVDPLSMIIIDSLPSLMFQYLGDDNKIGLVLLNTMVNYCRYLCKEMQIALVCVNIQTRWVDQDVADLEDEGEQATTTSHFKESHIEKRNRCLGKYWQNIPALVLVLEKLQDESTTTNDGDCIITKVEVIKSNRLKCDQNCVLKVSSLGVT